MREAVILLGGNVGNTEATLHRARVLLAERVGRVSRTSRLHETPAWGFDARPFVNQAAVVETSLEPEELLDVLQGIERELGRDRDAEAREKSATGARYVSRTIDLDILFYDDMRIDTPRLKIPHPLIREREFVMVPLRELGLI